MKENNSPFTPGNPVPVELFVGRVKQIEEILKYAKQSTHGRLENVFLVGERGIGKSSLAAFLKYMATTKENILGVYLSLGGINELKELIRRVIEQVLSELNKESDLKDKITSFFKDKSKYIQQVGLFGISLSFNPPENELEYMVRNFPETIKKLWDKIKDKKRGIFLVLDDINGLSRSKEFADWYKSFVDNVTIKYPGEFSVIVLAIGLPEIRDSLANTQPSLMRVFRIINIDKLEDKEVEEFFNKAFNSVGMEVKQKAMKLMVEFSSGLPILMHEIGDAVFWKDEDGVINEDDALKGIFDAADRIGTKYLDSKVYRAIRSERYRSILRKLVEMPIVSFRKRDIENRLNTNEKKVFNNFLRKMKELDVITPDIEGGRGAYKFTNMLYPVYIWMESLRFKKKLR